MFQLIRRKCVRYIYNIYFRQMEKYFLCECFVAEYILSRSEILCNTIYVLFYHDDFETIYSFNSIIWLNEAYTAYRAWEFWVVELHKHCVWYVVIRSIWSFIKNSVEEEVIFICLERLKKFFSVMGQTDNGGKNVLYKDKGSLM